MSLFQILVPKVRTWCERMFCSRVLCDFKRLHRRQWLRNKFRTQNVHVDHPAGYTARLFRLEILVIPSYHSGEDFHIDISQ